MDPPFSPMEYLLIDKLRQQEAAYNGTLQELGVRMRHWVIALNRFGNNDDSPMDRYPELDLMRDDIRRTLGDINQPTGGY